MTSENILDGTELLDARRSAMDACIEELNRRCNLTDNTDPSKVELLETAARLATESAHAKWDIYQEVATRYRAAVATAEMNRLMREQFPEGENSGEEVEGTEPSGDSPGDGDTDPVD